VCGIDLEVAELMPFERDSSEVQMWSARCVQKMEETGVMARDRHYS